LRRIDFQPLVDKAVSKLTIWNGKNINHVGMSTLVKAVLTSQAVYRLTSELLKPRWRKLITSEKASHGLDLTS
jgi:hypothetical protein